MDTTGAQSEAIFDSCFLGVVLTSNAPFAPYVVEREWCFLGRDQLMQSCQGVMLVFSITSLHSFESLAAYQNEVPHIKQVERIPMIVVGNKCDLEADRLVTAEEGEEYARRLNAPYLETSARKARTWKTPSCAW